MITIDGQNIKDTWTLEPVYGKYYEPLIQFPDMKDRITNDWDDEDGLEVLYSTGHYKEKECTISFFSDSIAMYYTFMKYLVANPTVVLYDSDLDMFFRIEYMTSSQPEYYRSWLMFTIKVRIADPLAEVYTDWILSSGYWVDAEYWVDTLNWIDSV